LAKEEAQKKLAMKPRPTPSFAGVNFGSFGCRTNPRKTFDENGNFEIQQNFNGQSSGFAEKNTIQDAKTPFNSV
jgi:hypothetical protein